MRSPILLAVLLLLPLLASCGGDGRGDVATDTMDTILSSDRTYTLTVTDSLNIPASDIPHTVTVLGSGSEMYLDGQESVVYHLQYKDGSLTMSYRDWRGKVTIRMDSGRTMFDEKCEAGGVVLWHVSGTLAH